MTVLELESSHSTHDEAIATVIQGLEAGEMVTVHADDCLVPTEHRCTCEPLAVWGPSGQA